MLMMHIGTQPKPLRTLNADVPEAVEATIMRSLAKDPNQRFASMADFQEALRPANRASTGSNPITAPSLRAPSQVPEQDTASPGDQSTGGPAVITWTKAMSTTLASTTGQVLTGKPTMRVRRGARRAILAGGVLVAAGFAAYLVVAHKGGQATSPTDQVRVAGSVLHPTAALVPTATPPDAALAVPTARLPDATPSPGTAGATKLAMDESPASSKRTDKTVGKKNAKKDGKKSLAVPPPPPPPTVSKEPAQPKPPPVTPQPKGSKPAERW